MFTAVTGSITRNYCIKYDYVQGSCDGSQPKDISFTCKVDDPEGYQMTTVMTIFTEGKTKIWKFILLLFEPSLISLNTIQLFNSEEITCNNAEYGAGRDGDTSSTECGEGQEGNKRAVCRSTGEWKLTEDTCIIIAIKELLITSQVGVLNHYHYFIKYFFYQVLKMIM